MASLFFTGAPEGCRGRAAATLYIIADAAAAKGLLNL
jgi:hypothetical protein